MAISNNINLNRCKNILDSYIKKYPKFKWLSYIIPYYKKVGELLISSSDPFDLEKEFHNQLEKSRVKLIYIDESYHDDLIYFGMVKTRRNFKGYSI